MTIHRNLLFLHESIISGSTAGADTYIKNNEFLSAAARLKIYTDGYKIRLAHTLESDLKCFIHLAKDDAYKLMRNYIESTPPNHYSIDQYHIRFTDFLQVVGCEKYILEMALLESAIAQVFWLPDSTRLTNEEFKEIDPAEFGNMNLYLRKASRLLEFEYDCEKYLKKFQSGNPPKALLKKLKNYVLVYRENREVLQVALTEAEYLILSAFDKGGTVMQAIEAASTENPKLEKQIMENIREWFASWVRRGFFRNQKESKYTQNSSGGKRMA